MEDFLDNIELKLFGAPLITRNGETIKIDTRKAIALLIYLAITREAHTRDSLAAMFWQENDQEHARGALRRTLSALRRAVGQNLLEITRHSVNLNLEADIRVDVWEFRSLRNQTKFKLLDSGENNTVFLSDLEAAAELYRGEFLEGFSLRDSLAFDDWQFFEREALRTELAETLDSLVEFLTQEDELQKAIHYTQRRLTLDPLHEPAHRALMRLYAWTGQNSAAIHQYRMCVNILDRELGVSPVEETIALYQQIQSRRLLPGPEKKLPESQPATTGVVTIALKSGTQSNFELPLLERDHELKKMFTFFEKHLDGGRLIVLEGEAGIGKTRLADEFASMLQIRGVTTLSSRCFEGEGEMAYSPFIDLLRKGIHTHAGEKLTNLLPVYWLNEAARLLPELTAVVDPAAIPPLDHPGARNRFYEGICQVLRLFTSQDQSGLILLDDVQWMDTASLDLLSYLIRRLGDLKLCILLAWQTEEVSASHLLRRLLVDSQRLNRSVHFLLKRLSQQAVEELSLRFSDSSVSSYRDLGARLYNETGGAPLLLNGYLRAIKEGELNPVESEWRMPTNLQDLLRARMANLNDTARQLLSAASVIGRSFEFEILQEASGRSLDEAVAGVELLVRRGFLLESTSKAGNSKGSSLNYDFSHPQLRGLIYDDTSRIRRRLIHARIAETLVKVGRRRGNLAAIAGVIAHHYYQSGEEQQAAEFYRLAGDHARSLYGNQEALNFYQNALAAGDNDAASLHISIGDMLVLIGKYKEALQHYETSASFESNAQVDLEQRIGNVYQRLGEWELSIQHYQAALELAESQKELIMQANILSELSLTKYLMGKLSLAQELASQSLVLSLKSRNPAAVAQSYNQMGILAHEQKQLEQAAACLEKSLEAARSSGVISLQIAALNNLAQVDGDRGESQSAIAHTQEALDLCSQIGDEHRRAALLNNMADLYHAAGDEEKSMDFLKRAVQILSRIGSEAGTEMVQIWNLREW